MRSSIRMDRYDQKKYSKKKKRKKPQEDLKIGERVYLLAERIKKKKLIDGIRYYWVRSPINDLPKRFLTAELFSLKSNFN